MMIYLDNAATTWPKPEEVYRRMDWFFREYGANPGRAGHKMAARAGREVYEVREKVAQFFGMEDSSQFIFTSNATHAINLGIRGVLSKGDHVITSALEHNSVIRPLKELEKEGIIELTIVGLTSEGSLDYQKIENEIKSNTKLIIVLHGSNLTGHMFDLVLLSSIAQKYRVLLMVDAAQTAGVFPIDLSEIPIDLLAVPGHKSLYGPVGTGVLFVKNGTHINSIFAGGTGSKSEELYQPDLWPDKFESGTVNSVGIVGLGAGLDFINQLGMEKIREHELNLCTKFIEGLHTIEHVKIYGPEATSLRTPVVSFNIGNESSSEVGYILDQVFDVAVRSGLHCSPLAHMTTGTLNQGMVRASFGYFNTVEDVNIALTAVRSIASEVL